MNLLNVKAVEEGVRKAINFKVFPAPKWLRDSPRSQVNFQSLAVADIMGESKHKYNIEHFQNTTGSL